MRYEIKAHIEEIKMSADGPVGVPEQGIRLLPTPDSWELFKRRMLVLGIGVHDFSWMGTEDGKTRLMFVLTRIPFTVLQTASLKVLMDQTGYELTKALDWQDANNSNEGG